MVPQFHRLSFGLWHTRHSWNLKGHKISKTAIRWEWNEWKPGSCNHCRCGNTVGHSSPSKSATCSPWKALVAAQHFNDSCLDLYFWCNEGTASAFSRGGRYTKFSVSVVVFMVKGAPIPSGAFTHRFKGRDMQTSGCQTSHLRQLPWFPRFPSIQGTAGNSWHTSVATSGQPVVISNLSWFPYHPRLKWNERNKNAFIQGNNVRLYHYVILSQSILNTCETLHICFRFFYFLLLCLFAWRVAESEIIISQ